MDKFSFCTFNCTVIAHLRYSYVKEIWIWCHNQIHWKNFCATIYVLYHQFTLKLLDVLANLVVIFMIKYPLEHHLLHHMSKDFTYHKFNFLKPRNEWWKKKPVYRDRYGLAPVMSNSDSLTPKSVLSSKFMIQFQD